MLSRPLVVLAACCPDRLLSEPLGVLTAGCPRRRLFWTHVGSDADGLDAVGSDRLLMILRCQKRSMGDARRTVTIDEPLPRAGVEGLDEFMVKRTMHRWFMEIAHKKGEESCRSELSGMEGWSWRPNGWHLFTKMFSVRGWEVRQERMLVVHGSCEECLRCGPLGMACPCGGQVGDEQCRFRTLEMRCRVPGVSTVDLVQQIHPAKLCNVAGKNAVHVLCKEVLERTERIAMAVVCHGRRELLVKVAEEMAHGGVRELVSQMEVVFEALGPAENGRLHEAGMDRTAFMMDWMDARNAVMGWAAHNAERRQTARVRQNLQHHPMMHGRAAGENRGERNEEADEE